VARVWNSTLSCKKGNESSQVEIGGGNERLTSKEGEASTRGVQAFFSFSFSNKKLLIVFIFFISNKLKQFPLVFIMPVWAN